MPKVRDYKGMRFGKLVVVGVHGHTPPPKRRRLLLNCVCDCGNTYIGRAEALCSGNTTSCGCAHWPKKHGHAGSGAGGKPSPTYRTWASMRGRCYVANYSPAYEYYGGAGVTVCDRWLGPEGFNNFLADMGERPPGCTLDRIDNSKGYSPDNCRWATSKQQYENKRVIRDAKGKFTKEM